MIERQRNVDRIDRLFINRNRFIGPLALTLVGPLLAALLVVMLTTACSRSASKGPLPTTAPAEASITIDQVQVTQGTGMYISGRSTIPSGECIRTELLAGGKPVDWWPADVCVEVEAGQWEMLVGLGHDRAPAQLPAGVQYEIHAWWPAQPETVSTRFPFDLDGPKE